MSWMDSWSRPGKSQAVPAPYYLLPGVGESTPYCRSCGRVISSRRTEKAAAHPATNNNGTPTGGKYCSARCRHSKPSKMDREIEEVFVKLLMGQSVEEIVAERVAAKTVDGQEAEGQGQGRELHKVGSSSAQLEDAENKIKERAANAAHKGHNRQKSKTVKGDGRILVPCDQVEEIVFGSRADPVKVFGRKKNRASRVIQGQGADAEEENNTAWSRGQIQSRQLTNRGSRDDNVDNSGGDSAVELDEDDFDDFDSDLDDFGLRRTTSGAAANNTVRHTAAAMSIRSGDRIRPAQTVSEVNGSVGGEKGWAERSAESEEMAQRRIEGQQRAQRKEMVRCAARRLVVFGYAVDEESGDRDSGGNGGSGGSGGSNSQRRKKKSSSSSTKPKGNHNNYHGDIDDKDEARGAAASRKCEAVMQGKVVEPSYAKGSWSVRWRED